MRVVIGTIAALFCACSFVFAFDDGDFQYWNTESMSFKIGKDWKANVETEFRFGDGLSDFYYQYSDLGVVYSGITEWLDVGVNYRLVYEEDDGDWNFENRPHYNVTLTYSFSDITVSDRNRFEHRIKEGWDQSWRYRNKLTVKLPLNVTAFEIQPYIADEIFVDFDDGEFDRNRLYGGITMKLLKNLKGDLFYLWQSSKSGSGWTDCHVIGSNLKLSF